MVQGWKESGKKKIRQERKYIGGGSTLVDNGFRIVKESDPCMGHLFLVIIISLGIEIKYRRDRLGVWLVQGYK